MMAQCKNLLSRLHRDDTGAMAVEKVLLIALIAIPLIVVLAVFRTKITTWFNSSTSNLDSNMPTGAGAVNGGG